MKRYIIEQLSKEGGLVTIMFTNGKSHSFSQVTTELADCSDLIELKLSDAQYIVLVNLDQISYVSRRS